jgi:hypothetical protein
MYVLFEQKTSQILAVHTFCTVSSTPIDDVLCCNTTATTKEAAAAAATACIEDASTSICSVFIAGSMAMGQEDWGNSNGDCNGNGSRATAMAMGQRLIIAIAIDRVGPWGAGVGEFYSVCFIQKS